MDIKSSPNSSLIILGRLFSNTIQTNIDISKSTLTIEFDGEIVHFNIFNNIKHHINFHSIFAIYAINRSMQEFSEYN